MKNRLFLSAMVAVACIAPGASAQETIPVAPTPRAEAPDTLSTTNRVASSIDRPSDAVRRSDVVAPALAPVPQATRSLGAAKAQMAVGAAAIVVGALIDGDGGQILMIGGAVVGLYGLWNYLK